ncbi:MAG: GAP family protein [Actinobacteria bacterium]|nr:GAP family protein [Actinomycetota bacterium]
MGTLLSQITAFLPIFLASPTMYAGMLLILNSPIHPRTRAFAAFLGSVVVAIVVGGLAFSAGGASEAVREPGDSSAVINIILGILLIFLGIKNLVRGPREKKPKKDKSTDAAATGLRFAKYLGIGAILTVTNPTSMASLIASSKLVLDSGLESTQQIMAMAVAAFYVTLPFLIPLALALVAPDLSTKFLNGVDNILKKYSRYIIAGILMLLGLYLIKKGVDIFNG